MAEPVSISRILSTRSTLASLGHYEITDDPARIDVDVVHGFLSRESYWRNGVSRERVERSISMSLPLAALDTDADSSTVAFMRVITDGSTHAWFDDLFVLHEHRGAGLGRALMRVALDHPAVRDASMQLLLTADAHGLYARDGFRPFPQPSLLMARWPR